MSLKVRPISCLGCGRRPHGGLGRGGLCRRCRAPLRVEYLRQIDAAVRSLTAGRDSLEEDAVEIVASRYHGDTMRDDL